MNHLSLVFSMMIFKRTTMQRTNSQRRATYERDWRKKSARSKYSKHCRFAIKRFFTANSYFYLHCFTACMVCNEKMVTGFCLPHQYQLDSICDNSSSCV